MPNYYVNKNAQTNGDHEVHTKDCIFIPSEANRISLGSFTTCTEAVKEAKKTYSKSNGCYHCSPFCHTT